MNPLALPSRWRRQYFSASAPRSPRRSSGEPITWQLVVAGLLMAIGVWLHLTERHEHLHRHAPHEHSHSHVHDEHHQHSHDSWDGAEPHTHVHRHAPLVHAHPHYPDLHHRHPH
jgi:hypothetical protein